MKGNHLVALISVLGAVYLAYKEKEGWGWLIFIAFIAL